MGIDGEARIGVQTQGAARVNPTADSRRSSLPGNMRHAEMHGPSLRPPDPQASRRARCECHRDFTEEHAPDERGEPGPRSQACFATSAYPRAARSGRWSHMAMHGIWPCRTSLIHWNGIARSPQCSASPSVGEVGFGWMQPFLMPRN